MASLARKNSGHIAVEKPTPVEWAAARFATGEATALRCNAIALIEAIGRLGTITASTGNANARVESTGIYRQAGFNDSGIGLVAGEGIDVRLLVDTWRYAFALEERRGATVHRSIEIFGRDGSALHTIELRPESDHHEFRKLVAAFGKPVFREVVDPFPPCGDPCFEETFVDAERFARAVAEMGDASEFASLLRRFGLRREQGLYLAGAPFAEPLARTAYRTILAEVYRAEISVQLLVASRGVVQGIASGGALGFVTNREGAPDISAPRSMLTQLRSRLDLRDEGVARTWLVRKPSGSGTAGNATSIECYDAAGNAVLHIAGEQRWNGTECRTWRALTERVAESEGRA